MSSIFDIEVTDNKNNCTLSLLDSSDYIWSNPSEYEPSNLDKISELLIQLIIDGVTSVGGGYFPWSNALSLISGMGCGTDESSVHANSIYHKWNFKPWINNASQYMYFRADIKPNETVLIECSYYIMGLGFEAYSPGTFKISLTAQPPHPHVDSLSNEQLSQYGIYKINSNNIEYYEQFLYLSDYQKQLIIESNIDNYIIEPQIEIEIIQDTNKSIKELIINDLLFNNSINTFLYYNNESTLKLTNKINNVY